MIYLSGHVNELLPEFGIGYMLTPLMGNAPDLSATPWAADNGCYSQPERYDLGSYLHWLIERPQKTCLFAVAPDVVGDARATWLRSRHVLPVLQQLGYRAAYVAQDGLSAESCPWDAFDVLFIGGTTEWKLSQVSLDLIAAAKRLGKWVHGGRVNSYRRMRLFAAYGCDSTDGTFLAFGRDKNLPQLVRWLRLLESKQPALGVGR